jgi:hypothetical protein
LTSNLLRCCCCCAHDRVCIWLQKVSSVSLVLCTNRPPFAWKCLMCHQHCMQQLRCKP